MNLSNRNTYTEFSCFFDVNSVLHQATHSTETTLHSDFSIMKVILCGQEYSVILFVIISRQSIKDMSRLKYVRSDHVCRISSLTLWFVFPHFIYMSMIEELNKMKDHSGMHPSDAKHDYSVQKSIGQKLEKDMLSKGMCRKDLENYCDTDKSTIGFYFNATTRPSGTLQAKDPKMLWQMCKALDVEHTLRTAMIVLFVSDISIDDFMESALDSAMSEEYLASLQAINLNFPNFSH